MIERLRSNIQAAMNAYDQQNAATEDTLQAVDTAIAAVQRLIEQNRAATSRTKVAYSFRGAMTRGGEQAATAQDQVRKILENQLHQLQAVRASLEKVAPLVASCESVAKSMLSVITES